MKRLRGCQLLALLLPFWELKHTPMFLTAPAHHPLPLYLSQPLPPPPFRSIPETPEGRSPSQPTLPSKKPREGVVPPGTGKPFILGSSLLTDSCVDWKVGCMLYGPRLHQPCGLSVPDPPPPHTPTTHPSGPPAPQPTTSSNAPIATPSHPTTHSNQPSSPLYFCLCFNPATYHPTFSLNLKNCHCFTVTFSWCFARADHLRLFYDKCVSHVLFGDLSSRKYTKQ